MPQIMAVHPWKTNAEMIREAFALHVTPGAVIVDPTFGKGNFYTELPSSYDIIGHDKHKGPRKDGVDWGDLPEADDSADVFVFDPPYVAMGGRKTSRIDGMHEAFGMLSADHSPEALWTSILTGFDEAQRVLKRSGLFMFKMMPYVSSGHVQNVIRWTFDALDDRGFVLWDWFIMDGDPGPQPLKDKCKVCNGRDVDPTRIGITQRFVMEDLNGDGHYVDEVCEACGGLGGKPRRQVHARNNASHLIVARKRKMRRR